ncbi:(2Fe-2S)-binding protein [Williamwhitmania taraxaci]|uniref:Nitrite reductase (NADH) large subunit n=1 Tax=Williamwhitmania taraxaci TaxID=1640674 RepID=A0A1G6GN79_9BACT|nr:(2Fe-2S)-binding protein [Williamwhitmania taraxaci]SDB83398.1 nitrite reductase (NADH) large subunit [Williamwhitmania taraxaci]
MKICSCYEVSKSELVKAIRKQMLESIVDVQVVTKASTGCGRCKPVVLEILKREVDKRSDKNTQLRLPF